MVFCDLMVKTFPCTHVAMILGHALDGAEVRLKAFCPQFEEYPLKWTFLRSTVYFIYGELVQTLKAYYGYIYQ